MKASTASPAWRIMARKAPRSIFVIRHYELGEGVIAAQDNVAALLSFSVEPNELQRLDALAPGDPWQFAHTATSSASR